LGPACRACIRKTSLLCRVHRNRVCAPALTSTLHHPNQISVWRFPARIIRRCRGFLPDYRPHSRLKNRLTVLFSTGKSSHLEDGWFQFAVINLLIGAVIPIIDISAHVGGLVSGLIIGLFFFPASRETVGRAPRPPCKPARRPSTTSIESRSASRNRPLISPPDSPIKRPTYRASCCRAIPSIY